mgnify:CR=1 FL=1
MPNYPVPIPPFAFAESALSAEGGKSGHRWPHNSGSFPESRLPSLEALASAVADMQHLHAPILLHDPENHSVDVRLLPVHQMPQTGVLRRLRTSARPFFEAQDGFRQPPVPFECGGGAPGVNRVE